jgi:hypothetical protein
MSRTCASVRSSLSAQARRVIAASEAAETMYLRPAMDQAASVSERSRLPASGGLRARLGGMSNVSELPSGTVKISRAKDAEWLRPKGTRSSCSASVLGAHGYQHRRCNGRG